MQHFVNRWLRELLKIWRTKVASVAGESVRFKTVAAKLANQDHRLSNREQESGEIISHYNSSVRITATPLMLCVLILYMSGGTHSVDAVRQFFEKFSMTILYFLRVSARNLLRGSRWRNIIQRTYRFLRPSKLLLGNYKSSDWHFRPKESFVSVLLYIFKPTM